MIDKVGGYRRYNCKKCSEGNHWVWSWSCIKKPKIGRKYRDHWHRGDIEDSSYRSDGRLRKKDKPPYTRNQLALNEYKRQYSKLDPVQKEGIDEDYDSAAEEIETDFRLGPAVPQPTIDVLVGKDRYWISLSESLNVDELFSDCNKCGYGIAFCEPHWVVTREHYGNTSTVSNYFHQWCYKI